MAGRYLFACGTAMCVLLLAGCARTVEYAPPPQTTIPEGAERALIYPVIDMSDPRADGFIIRDVSAPGGGVPREYRWTGRNPSFRVWLDNAQRREFRMRIAVPQATFAATGPVTASVLVNGNRIAAPRFDRPGLHDFSCPLRPSVLPLPMAGGLPVIVALDISPVFTDSRTRKELGVLLYSIGLPSAVVR